MEQLIVDFKNLSVLEVDFKDLTGETPKRQLIEPA